MENSWPTKTITEVLENLHSGERGLSKEEAGRRLREYGANKLPEAKADNLALVFLRQFQSPLIYILFAASLVVLAMAEIVDGSIILAVLLFNAIVGTIQEGKAQNTLLALKKFAETKTAVLRDGEEFIVPDTEITPGDIIILQEGEKVPADARIILSHNIKVDEAALTGESETVHKVADTLGKKDLPPQEQKNIVFKGTHIVAGSGKAVVIATGHRTLIGQIAKKLTAIDTEIPLKTNIRYLSGIIIMVVASISVLLFLLGIASGKSVKEMFTTIVSLSVSVIPEGLPIVMTLVLATGVWRMSRQNVLVKKLQAVEALGQARIIAVDKTGTITKNEMVIQKVYVDDKLFEVSGIGYEPKGEIRLKKNMANSTLNDIPDQTKIVQAFNVVDPANHPELLLTGKIAAFCANARVMFSEETKQWRVAGDPTEAAMLILAQKLGFHKDDLERESPKIAEIPFDYKTKYHATAHSIESVENSISSEAGGHTLITIVGAPETLLGLSNNLWHQNRVSQLTKEKRESLEGVFFKMSQEGIRVLAMAIQENASPNLNPEKIRDLTFVGFLGMKDALRPEATEAVQKAVAAGIQITMITGDHKTTAQAIAKEAGILKDNNAILTGPEIDTLSDAELSKKLVGTTVFARVTPDHKLRIIKAYKARGEIVAMTGDGVNDAPSLVAADLGVAMGKIGTEVAKEAADIVLLDDNFGSIVSAIEEGRSIYKTIKKVILYLFSTSAGEVLTIVGAIFLGYPLPILPSQIIWLNFVTDGFLDVALAMEPKEKDLLQSNFERPKKYLVDKLMTQRIFLMAPVMAIGSLYLFNGYFENDLTKAWTISLTALAVFQWFNAWNCRSEKKSIFQMNPFSNKFLIGATLIIISLHMLAVYNPVMQKLLHTKPLALSDWAIIVPIAFSIILVEEIRKKFYPVRKQKPANSG